MAVFSERTPLPKPVTYEIVEGAALKEVKEERQIKDVLIREVEVIIQPQQVDSEA